MAKSKPIYIIEELSAEWGWSPVGDDYNEKAALGYARANQERGGTPCRVTRYLPDPKYKVQQFGSKEK